MAGCDSVSAAETHSRTGPSVKLKNRKILKLRRLLLGETYGAIGSPHGGLLIGSLQTFVKRCALGLQKGANCLCLANEAPAGYKSRLALHSCRSVVRIRF